MSLTPKDPEVSSEFPASSSSSHQIASHRRNTITIHAPETTKGEKGNASLTLADSHKTKLRHIVWFSLAKAFAFRFCKRKIQQPPLSKVKLRQQLASLILFFIVLPPPPTTYSTLKFYFHFYHVIQY